ncbi:hypothetical protein [Paenibacillus sp. DMB5]|uniref:hypothetical protein n=1 Tax=Paenibacillus sp. DMB5 TaxID=1780103 RepID=UPI00076D2557|nr:hypothetical protein [Paenibacillus sp. DMB5]KUP24269.1 hypothetical protein AWJ19_13715 [Paenibacillus sp. DMB5]
MRNITIRPNGFGMFMKDEIKKTGLPVFDFTIDSEAPISIMMCTTKELKNYGITLSKEQRERLDVVGFLRMNGFRGYSALYCLNDVLMDIASTK